MDAAYKVAEKVELITPARFLFNAGGPSKSWNEKTLNDEHLKVLAYYEDGNSVFPSVDIKGGIAITYRDAGKKIGPIGTFTKFPELNSILRKVASAPGWESLSSCIFVQNRFNLPALYEDHPGYRSIIGSNGADKRFRNNIFSRIPAFTKESVDADDIAVYGLVDNKRVWRYLPEKYFDKQHGNLYRWKTLVPVAGGSGAFGEAIGQPFIEQPRQAYTQTFIGIGSFAAENEAEACLKYVKTKFARAILGVLKVTQHNPAKTWGYVPLQDFSSSSDIDWSQSVTGIDRQLYAKYGLDRDEIDFVESRVKEMD